MCGFSFTKKEKDILGAIKPFAYCLDENRKRVRCFPKLTKESLAHLKNVAKGHYWNDKEMQEYVAYSYSGQRKFFEYDSSDEKEARMAAKYWAQRGWRKFYGWDERTVPTLGHKLSGQFAYPKDN